MLHVLRTIKELHGPNGHIGVAVSGGPDSMALLHFLGQFPQNRIKLFHVNHGTGAFADMAEQLVWEYYFKHDNLVSIDVKTVLKSKPCDQSPEEFWRNERLEFFHEQNVNILTGHNLDDVAEQWIFSSLHGNPKLMPYKNCNIYKPFMLNTKQELTDYCIKNNVPFLIDPSNDNRKYMRNVIRHDIMPHALKVNPGLYKVIKKKLRLENDIL
jgi:tRNA(Ile)-lysidine synthetase-like protein